MKPQTSKVVLSVVFCVLVIDAIVGLYLFAGRQERRAAEAMQTATPPSPAPTVRAAAAPPVSSQATDAPISDASAPAAAPGSEAFFRAMDAAGFALSKTDTASYAVRRTAGGAVLCTLIPSETEGAVMGATLRFDNPPKPVQTPAKSSGKKAKPTSAIEAALEAREKADAPDSAVPEGLADVLSAVFDALDRYGELPSTVRLRWIAEAEAAAASGKAYSDTEGGVKFDLYDSGSGSGTALCCAVQFPAAG